MIHLQLSADLISVIGDEKIDFSVYAKRKEPIAASISLIIFALIWTAFPAIFASAFWLPLFKEREVHFTSGNEPVTASWSNFEPMIVPSLFISFFLIIGIVLLFWGFYSLMQKGGYFVGTNQRLIHYNKGEIKYYNWDLFSGNVTLNYKKKDISLELKTGKIITSKNKNDEFQPDVVYISAIENLLEVEKICRQHIYENKELKR